MTAGFRGRPQPGPAPRVDASRPRREAPTRAWLQPSQDRHLWRGDRGTTEMWSMFLEESRETLDGPFEQLVGIARSRGVGEMHVWSRSRLTFEPFDPSPRAG